MKRALRLLRFLVCSTIGLFAWVALAETPQNFDPSLSDPKAIQLADTVMTAMGTPMAPVSTSRFISMKMRSPDGRDARSAWLLASCSLAGSISNPSS